MGQAKVLKNITEPGQFGQTVVIKSPRWGGQGFEDVQSDGLSIFAGVGSDESGEDDFILDIAIAEGIASGGE